MIYFTSDIHFFHENILKYQESTRPFDTVEEMNDFIIRKWNRTVTNKDEIYVLGDFAMGHKEKAIKLIKKLNGHIHLIRGNHDHFSKEQEAEIFSSAQDYKVLRYNKERFVLFHYPIQEWDRCYYGDMHLHGHSHGNLKDIKPNRFDMGWDIHKRLVSIEEVKTWRVNEHVPQHGNTRSRDGTLPT